MLGDLGEFLGHVGTLGAFKIIDNHQRSDNADDDRATLDEQGRQVWQGDRDIIANEWSRLRSGTDVALAKEAVTSPEAFSTWSHQQIWEALNGSGGAPGVSAAEINAGADGWRRLTEGTQAAVDAYRAEMERVLAEKWVGQSGNAAIEAVKSYATESAKLPTAFQMVANGIDYMEGLLGQAKIAIPPPEELSGFDEFVGHIPGNGVIKAAKHRANEAEADAQLFMIGTYQPGATTVDRQTPVLPVPVNTVGDNGPGGTPNMNVDNGTGTPSSTTPSGTPGNPAGTENPETAPADPEDASTEQSTDQQATDSDGTPDDTDSADTTPTSTTPTNTTPSTVPTSTTPTTDRPTTSVDPRTGTPSPTTSVPGTTSTPDPGRSVPGSPNNNTAAVAPAARTGTGTGTRGMSGMPGMMGAGRGANSGDDENERKTPDYLVQDREHELIGRLPPTLPAGGVIGG